MLLKLIKLHPLMFYIVTSFTLESFSLLYLSVSTRVVIGQFSGPYFTIRPAKTESCLFPARPINLGDTINILLIPFSRSVL